MLHSKNKTKQKRLIKGGGGGVERGRMEGEGYSNSKTVILKDSSIRSIWTYLTASPCYTTNKHDNPTNKYYKHD